MKVTIAAIATAATLTTATFVPVQANAAIHTLGECYDAVITWCNQAHPNHAQECAGGGMDECDEEFANSVPNGGFDQIKVRPTGKGFKWRLVKLNRAYNSPGDEDDSNGRRPRPTPPTRTLVATH